MIVCLTMPHIGIAVERRRLDHLNNQAIGLALADGTLAAVSEETAPFGIRAGQEVIGARGLCERLVVLPYDREAYEEAAKPVWDLLAIESSFVQPDGPEICYAELSGIDVVERAKKLATSAAETAGTTVQAGLARTKFLALQGAISTQPAPPRSETKALSYSDKTARNGACTVQRNILDPASESDFLATIPIANIPHLEAKLKQQMAMLGVRTLGDVRRIPQRDLQRKLKDAGLILERLARGEDGDPVKPLWPPRTIESSIEFEEEVIDLAQIHEALRRRAEALAGSLGREYCRTLALNVVHSDETCMKEREKISMPINAAVPIYRAGMRLLGRMNIARPVVSLTLSASDIGAGSGLQLALIDDNSHATGLPHERERSLKATFNYLCNRFGPEAARKGEAMRQPRRIGLWTYPLGSLLDEPVRVETDARGRPVRFWRQGSLREVTSIQNHWKEAEWFWGGITEAEFYRVQTAANAVCELKRQGDEWLLTGLAD